MVLDFNFVDDTITFILSTLRDPPVLSLLGSRMLFNMKEAGECGVNEGTNCMASTMSEIRFGSPARDEGTRTETTIPESA